MCCVCKKMSHEAEHLLYTIEFVTWGQCDRCNHWTHLKYCSKSRSYGEMKVFTALLAKISVKMLIYYQKLEKNVSVKS